MSLLVSYMASSASLPTGSVWFPVLHAPVPGPDGPVLTPHLEGGPAAVHEGEGGGGVWDARVLHCGTCWKSSSKLCSSFVLYLPGKVCASIHPFTLVRIVL
jgi:hypothetical protein